MSKNAFIFVCGPDDFLVLREAKEAWSRWEREIPDDLGREIIDGGAGTVSEIRDAVSGFLGAAQTMPMFGERKAVWFRGVSFLGDTASGKTDGALKQIERLQAGMGKLNAEGVSILVSACPIDRRRKEYKWFQEHFDVRFVGDSRKGDEVVQGLIQEEAARLGVRFGPGAAELLVGKINGNARLAVEEVRKLATWLGSENDGQIQESAVADLVPAFGEGDFFEAAEAFFSRNLPWALEAVQRHFFAGYEARSLLSNLQNRNRLLIQLRALLDAGMIGASIGKGQLERVGQSFAEMFPDGNEKSAFNIFTQNPWYLTRLLGTARNFSLRQLISFQNEFLRAFTGILERPREEEAVIRETTIRCLS